MSISGGGGYCDCGDPEAWKSEPHCETHGKGTGMEEEQVRKEHSMHPPHLHFC